MLRLHTYKHVGTSMLFDCSLGFLNSDTVASLSFKGVLEYPMIFPLKHTYLFPGMPRNCSVSLLSSDTDASLQILFGWLAFSVASLLGFSGGALFYSLITTFYQYDCLSPLPLAESVLEPSAFDCTCVQCVPVCPLHVIRLCLANSCSRTSMHLSRLL